jgi:hypothetical protein
VTAPWQDPAVQGYCRLLADSFVRLTGRSLIPVAATDDAALAGMLHDLAQPLVSHGTGADPIFRYGNAAALALWQMGWAEFTALPSRRSAEADPAIQSDRSAHLQRALQRGWTDGYSGIRIAASGARFRIRDTVLWTVTDRDGVIHGQAALIGTVDRL